MASTHVTEIKIDAPLVQKLKELDFVLCVFQGVAVNSRGFVPLVTQVLNKTHYQGTTTLSFTHNDLAAFISTQELTEGTQFKVARPSLHPFIEAPAVGTNSKAIVKGEEIIIDKNGNLSARNTGDSCLQLHSNSPSTYTTGIGKINSQDKDLRLFCAATIINGTTFKLNPVNKVLLTFTRNIGFVAGAYMELLSNFGMSIETSATEVRKVKYTIKDGWDANHAAWAEQFQSGVNLAEILISELS